MANRQTGVIGAGNWIIDHVKMIDDYPGEENLANIRSEASANGGAAYNLLKDLALMQAGIPLVALGKIGQDADGEYILADCEQLGIDTAHLQVTPQYATSYTDVMTSLRSGKRTFFHQRGANAALQISDFDFEQLPGKILHLGYLLLLDQLDEVDDTGRSQASHLLERAQRAGLLTSVDVVSESSDRFGRIVPSALPFTDYLFVNEYEAGAITGIRLSATGTDWQLAERAARRLLEMGVRQAVFLHFAEGVVACQANGGTWTQGRALVPKEWIKGTAGAGDALAAGVLFGLHQGWEMGQCLRLGVSVAGCSLLAPSCSGSIGPWQEALKWAEGLGFLPALRQKA